MVTGTKVITGNQNVDFGSVALFGVNDEKIISDEKVVNAITCDFPCKILKKFTVMGSLWRPRDPGHLMTAGAPSWPDATVSKQA